MISFVPLDNTPEYIADNKQLSFNSGVIKPVNIYPNTDNKFNYEQPKPYAYEYAVEDAYHGTKFSAEENSDLAGNVVGSYSVLLPDGRTQYVNYNADHDHGFIAAVRYVDHSPGTSGSGGRNNLENNNVRLLDVKTLPTLREGKLDHVSVLPSFTQKSRQRFNSYRRNQDNSTRSLLKINNFSI